MGPYGLSACSAAEADVAGGCPACRVTVLNSLLLSKVARFQRLSQQRRRQSSLENVLMINVSGTSAENVSAYLRLQGGVFVDGWVGEWLALILMSTPALFVWVWLSDDGCALPHRGHYPVLVSAGLHLGGQRDSDMSTWWEAADGWTHTSLSRWVSVSLCVYYRVFVCLH